MWLGGRSDQRKGLGIREGGRGRKGGEGLPGQWGCHTCQVRDFRSLVMHMAVQEGAASPGGTLPLAFSPH